MPDEKTATTARASEGLTRLFMREGGDPCFLVLARAPGQSPYRLIVVSLEEATNRCIIPRKRRLRRSPRRGSAMRDLTNREECGRTTFQAKGFPPAPSFPKEKGNGL